MVQDAEKYKAEDEGQRERVSAKNNLESYCFNMKQTVEDEKVTTFFIVDFYSILLFQLKDKISEDDKKKILDKCNEIIHWLDANQTAEKEEFEHQLKDVEAVCSPIITKLYQGAGGAPGGMPGGFPGGAAPGAGAQSGGGSGPTIEEVD